MSSLIFVAPSSPPPAALRELTALVRHLEDLPQTRSQVSNRLSMTHSPTVQAQLQAQLTLLDAQIQQNKPFTTTWTAIPT